MRKARYSGIPIWLFDDDTFEGRNRWCQILVRIMVFIDTRILGLYFVNVTLED